MSRDLAQQIECHLQAPVFELLGSTETLSFASRQATHCEYWQPYAGIKLSLKDTSFYLSGGHVFTELRLDDQFEISPNGSFKLLGRASDLIKIAGKRASLNELNQHLSQIEGVDDGVFFASKNERLSAIVVSSLSKQQIINALKANIDEVFLPRSLYTVSSLPRNTLGKLIKLELEQLIQTQQNARK
ncbi:MAG: hypothetical protein GQ582_12745 [Methyloprofundus sp.]|nr:hypothetical protein [Methyloprofundus sp.]